MVTIFVYDAGGKLICEYSNVVQTGDNAKVLYLTSDQLGSPRIITDGTGQVVSRHDYLPFGEEITRSGYGADSVRKQFTGYERDRETSQDYAQARYFSPGFGRFSSPDSLGGRLESPQSLNRYSYVLNNPLRYVDPLGLQCKESDRSGSGDNCIWVAKDGLYESMWQSQFKQGNDLFDSGYQVTDFKSVEPFVLNTINNNDANADNTTVLEPLRGMLVEANEDGSFAAVDLDIGGGESSENVTQVPPGSGYFDFNVTGGNLIGVTAGVLAASGPRFHPYLGASLTTPGISGSVSYSPDTVTPGWNAQIQVMALVGGAVGIDRKQQSFTEFGVGNPSASGSILWVFGDDDGTVPLPAPGPNAAVNSPTDYNRRRSPNCACNVQVPR